MLGELNEIMLDILAVVVLVLVMTMMTVRLVLVMMIMVMRMMVLVLMRMMTVADAIVRCRKSALCKLWEGVCGVE